MKSASKTLGIIVVLFVIGLVLLQPGTRLTSPSEVAAQGTEEFTFYVSEAVTPHLSIAVRDLPPRQQEPLLEREINSLKNPHFLSEEMGLQGSNTKGLDPLAARSMLDTGNAPEPIFTFEGLGTDGFTPPDTVGDVGPNHYIQMVNVSFAIWEKNTKPDLPPTLVQSDTLFNALFVGYGGVCETQNNGDPIVLYDEMADRWLLSQFADPAGSHTMCIAISQTPDPTGAYYLYDFQTPEYPDYFKFGVWPDGYYMSTNTGFPNQYYAFAFDRQNMLAGNAATFQSFGGYANFMMPSDLDGQMPPPPGSPNYFYTFFDGDYPNHPAGVDRLALYEFDVDWETPVNSTFTLAQELPIAAYNYTVCGFFVGNCIPQPGSAQGLDSLSYWPMFRFAYRNLGGYEAMVGNFTVDLDGSDKAAIRWFELRNGDSGWMLHQEGTHAPDDDHRFLGSIAMDGSGNIALGYTVSSESTFPAIRYATRLANDPLGTLQAEASIIEGSGSQTGGSQNISRWGDYSAMSIDPADNCTFWYTSEYHDDDDSGFNWNTHVGTFRLPNCMGSLGPRGILKGTISDSSDASPISGAQIAASPILTQTGVTSSDQNGHYSMSLPEHPDYELTAAAYGYQPATVTAISVISGTTNTLDIALEPTNFYTVTGIVSDATTGWPLYASISINGEPTSPPDNDIWTNPETGAYSIILATNVTYTFNVSAWVPGYKSTSGTVAPLTSDTTADFALEADLNACIAPGYVMTMDCSPTAGGLVVGHVYEQHTSDAINGALVSHQSGEIASTVETPDDPAVDDGFYTLFSPEGPHLFTTTFTADYMPDVKSLKVVLSDTIRQDFVLKGFSLTYNPPDIEAFMQIGDVVTNTVTVTNPSPLDIDFSISISNQEEPVVLVEANSTSINIAEQEMSPWQQWAFAVPSGGAIPAGGSTTFDVLFDARSPLERGIYTATLSFSGSFTGDVATMPLTMHLGCPTCGFFTGQITEFESGAPLTATINVTDTNGLDVTLTGAHYFIAVEPGSYNVTVSANGYLSQTASLVASQKITVTTDFALQPMIAKLEYSPAAIEEVMDFGDVVTNSVTVTNTGYVDLEFNVNIESIDGPTVPPLPLAQAEEPRQSLYRSEIPRFPRRVGSSSWPSAVPSSGTVPAGQSTTFDVIFDARLPLERGIYTSSLSFSGNFTGDVATMPLTMHLGCPTCGVLTGQITDFETDAPLTATINVTDTNGLDVTLTGADYLIVVEPGSYNFTVSASGYLSQTANLVVNQTITLTTDFALQPMIAKLQYSPAAIEEVMQFGDVVTNSVTVTNRGYIDLEFNVNIESVDGSRVAALPLAQADEPLAWLYRSEIARFQRRIGSGSWASAVPSSGTVPAGQSTTFDVLFDARSLFEKGHYTASLSFSGNFTGDVATMPLTMHLDCPTCGFFTGQITDAFIVDPLIADIHLTGPNDFDVTLTGDDYAIAIQPGSYDLTVSAAGYFSQSATVTASSDITTTTDFDLMPLVALLESDPGTFEVTVGLGESIAQALTISNNGTAAFNFALSDVETGSPAPLRQSTTPLAIGYQTYQDAPWLLQAPMSGTIEGGNSMEIELIFDTTVLTQTGTYSASIRIEGDFDNQVAEIPVVLIVEEPEPEMDVEVEEPHITLNVGQKVLQILTISNTGNTVIDWQAFTEEFSGRLVLAGTCSTDNPELNWIEIAPTSGTIQPGEAADLEMTADATGLQPDSYSGNLCVTSPDEQLLLAIPMMLTVKSESMTSTPTNTPTGTISPTATNTPTGSASPTATNTPTIDPSSSPTNRPTIDPLSSPTNTPTIDPLSSPTNTPTIDPSYSPTNTPSASATPTPESPTIYLPLIRK